MSTSDNALSDDLVLGVAEDPLGRGVEVDDPSATVHGHDGVEGGLEHGARARLGQLAMAEIGHHGEVTMLIEGGSGQENGHAVPSRRTYSFS